MRLIYHKIQAVFSDSLITMFQFVYLNLKFKFESLYPLSIIEAFIVNESDKAFKSILSHEATACNALGKFILVHGK